nr:MAG TPA: hypothetical protein [Caudoviricetes sp.]DAM55981.1 MAG TPA: hypothetical protein [Caudoviricetes sp.]
MTVSGYFQYFCFTDTGRKVDYHGADHRTPNDCFEQERPMKCTAFYTGQIDDVSQYFVIFHLMWFYENKLPCFSRFRQMSM